MNVTCAACGGENIFAQPYPYHAGFSDRGFLYNEAGTSTLIWSTYDPDYVALVGRFHAWTLSSEQRAFLEQALAPAPSGGRWLFANSPRCMGCGAPIGKPLVEGNIYYFAYPGSKEVPFRSALQAAPTSRWSMP
jgi:hypothetical protein